jgi:hypothetical protein
VSIEPPSADGTAERQERIEPYSIERELSCLGVLLKEKMVMMITLLYSSLVLVSEGFGLRATACLVVH